MADLNWDILQMERKLPDGDQCPDGAVYRAQYIVNLEEQGQIACLSGSVDFGDPDPDDFTPFNEITRNMAIDWVKATLGDETINEIRSVLERQIQAALQPKTAAGLPW